MATPQDFYTIGTMATLSGATGATFVVCNRIQRAFNVNPRWLGLLVAQIIVLGGAYATGQRELIDYLVGIINGFLVYCSAAGATGALGSGGHAGAMTGTVAGPAVGAGTAAAGGAAAAEGTAADTVTTASRTQGASRLERRPRGASVAAGPTRRRFLSPWF